MKTTKKKISKNDQLVLKLAKTISDRVHKQTIVMLTKWIDTKFEEKLNKAVETFVEAEFRKEILPVLKHHIDAKLKQMDFNKGVELRHMLSEAMMKISEELTEG